MTAVLSATHAVHPRHLADFHRWATDIQRAAAARPGFVAGIRLEQPGGLTHFVQHFEDEDALRRWQDSDDFRARTRDGEAMSVALRQTASDGEPIVDVPAQASAPKWKSFLLTWAAVLPVSLLLATGLRALFPGLPPPVQTAIQSALLTGLLTWVILPPIQRRAVGWLLRSAEGKMHQ